VQVAKRKAEELEDFGGESRETTALRMLTPATDGSEDTSSAKFSKMETDEGTAVMKAFLDEWKASVEGQGDLSEEAQVAELKRIAEVYKQRFESSPWIKNLLKTF
jgi:DNA mismatch repair protein MSH2